MKVTAVIPMKLNNQRLPNKNILPFTNGKPLCTYILSTLLTVKQIDEVYVYCSNPMIKEYLPAGVKYLKRPESLDTNSTKMNEVLLSFADEIPSDVYLLSHVTSPFISAGSIEKGINAVLNDGFDSAFAVKKIQDFLWKDNAPFNYDLANIPRTQDLAPLYQETSGFYVFESNVIKKLGRRIGEKPFMVEVSEVESVDIDEAEDFLIADALYNYQLKNETN